MRDIVAAIAGSPVYSVVLIFFAIYPLLAAFMWILTSLIYFVRREAPADKSFYDVPEESLPLVSLIIPAYNESLTTCGAMTAFLSS